MGNAEKTNKYAHLEQFSTQQLEDILRADLELQEGGDPDMVLYILNVIEKRENGKSLESRVDAERALKKFHEFYHISEGVGQSLYPADTNDDKNGKRSAAPQTKKYHRLRRLLIPAAAAAIITLFLVPPVLGYETFYEMVGTWTESTFKFINKDGADDIDTVWQEEMNTYGISASVLPTKIPKDFELTDWDIDEQELSGDIMFSAYYTKDEMYFVISVIRYSKPMSSIIEKDETPVEEYMVDGQTYYLFKNLEDHVATWYVDGLECTLYGDISIDDLKMMIDSIKGSTK